MVQPNTCLRDRYELQRQLGHNAGRQTWLAKDLSVTPPQLVIVKLLGFVDQVDWDTLKLFEREAQILKNINHPRIPKYRDYFSMNDRVLWFGMVQEYIPGTSFRKLLAQKQRFSETQTVKIATEILEILVHLHDLNPPVFHRDIKPSNLILGKDKCVHLIDFGAVQDRAAIEGRTFTVVGTYGYTPMEQFGGRTVAASDIYALGATLIHLLTGIAPADLPQRDLRLQFAEQVSLSSGLENWLKRATEPNLEKRFQDANAALKELQHPQSLRRKEPKRSAQNSIQRHKPSQAAIVKPSSSHVEIMESHYQLTVLCGSKSGCKGAASLGMGTSAFILLMFVGYLLEGILLPSLLVMSIVTLLLGVQKESSTRLVLGRRYFAIYQDFPPFLKPLLDTSCQTMQPTAKIQSVIQHNVTMRRGKSKVTRRVVTIQTASEDFSFGYGLSKAECVWIAATLNRWLGLS